MERISSSKIRRISQLIFLGVVVLIGIRFSLFVSSLARPYGALASRPAGVEAFLPISSLMGLVYLIKAGVANRVHPAGLVLFALILGLSVAMRRGFCSWVCLIGTMSEYAHKAGARLFRRNVRMPLYLDATLQCIKYILLGFFLIMVLKTSTASLAGFAKSPYNRISDVKMYMFFTHISGTALTVILALLGLSMVFKNFWCRYLCPYGALLGILRSEEHTSELQSQR